MKRFILILTVVTLCLAQENDKEKTKRGPWSIPGCNITNFPKNLNRSQCCLSKPKSFNQSAAAVCKADSPKTDNRTELACYWSKCMLKQSGYTNQDGKFDSAIAAAKLESSTKKIDIWKPIINATVDKCVAAAPSLVESQKKRTNRTDTCGDGLNKVIAHCIARELFIQCPESEKNTTNENCTKLFDFAKSCPAYPFFGHGGPGRNSKVEKSKNQQEQKGNADQNKSKGKNGESASTENPKGKNKDNQANKSADKQTNKQSQGNQNKSTGQPKKS